MEGKSSGLYLIDADYSVVAVNQTIQELYPSLKVGEKCYKCLMNQEEPCAVCPVANHVQGPQTYIDPIRGIGETVDAVEVILPDGGVGHALVLSTVGESATIAARLPRNKNELKKLLEQEYFDSLTGGCTRKGFIHQSERVLFRSNMTDYAMILFDIRNFKAINDTFGVEDGDSVLKFVFETLKDSYLKPIVSARIESDWFLFLVRRGRIDRDRLEPLLNLEWAKDNHKVHLHLRCGIYYLEDSQASTSRMIEWTIMAEQLAGREDHGNVVVFDASMRERYIDQAEILTSFSDSITNKDFKVYYQPVVEAASGKVIGAEALVRWIHPTRGLIGPNRFIPALETNGFITQLDYYVLQQVYTFQQSLHTGGMPSVPISVNLSRQDFYDDSFISHVLNLAQESSLPTDSINYEVTETAVALLKENCRYLLQQVRLGGAKVLLDDFGSGFSSLGMVGDYSFDVVKIDKSFIDQIDAEPTVRTVIESTIDMCHGIGLRVIAEGVEGASQLEFLKGCGCDYIQGYYFSRPLSEGDFCDYLFKAQIGRQSDAVVLSPRDSQPFDLRDMLDLVDHSGLFIQVCHPEDYSMVYANAMTRDISGHPERPYEGEKCYRYMLGLDAPCGHCPMKLMGDEDERELEVDDGSHVFALKARYANLHGRRIFIEYGHDITGTKLAQQRYTDQIRAILETIPDGQGVFHVDLTADSWISSGGNAQNARDMQDLEDVDSLIRRIGSFVPDEKGKERFFDTFCRDAQLQAYADGRREVVLETESYYDDRSIRWSRITAHLIDNPSTGNVESIIYGVDISQERERIKEIEREKELAAGGNGQPLLKVDDASKPFGRADHDRRYDLLTGLGSRLDLTDSFRRMRRGEEERVFAAMMIDVDDFKSLNDSLGFEVGDECLCALGAMLGEYGKREGVTFYRYGGEEFVGLVRTNTKALDEKCQRLLDEVGGRRISLSNEDEVSLTVSLGYTTHVDDYLEMIAQCDRALYAAKKLGKNRFVCLD